MILDGRIDIVSGQKEKKRSTFDHGSPPDRGQAPPHYEYSWLIPCTFHATGPVQTAPHFFTPTVFKPQLSKIWQCYWSQPNLVTFIRLILYSLL